MSYMIESKAGGAVGLSCGPAMDSSPGDRIRLIRLSVFRDGRGVEVLLTPREAAFVADELKARARDVEDALPAWRAASAPTPASTHPPAWCLPSEPLRSWHYEWWAPHGAVAAHLIAHPPFGEHEVPYRHGEGKALCGATFEWTALTHPTPNNTKTRPLVTCMNCDAMMADAEPVSMHPLRICRCVRFKGQIHYARVSCVDVTDGGK